MSSITPSASRRPGFVFMNTPGYDPVSLTGLAAGGCNLIAFTTGRGSAIGFPTDPGDQDRQQQRHLPPHDGQHGRQRGPHRRWRSDRAAGGPRDLRHGAARRSGERTCAERLGHKEFVPWRIGPVM